MTKYTVLQLSLRANALFSTACVIFIVAQASWLVGEFGGLAELWFYISAALLGIFALRVLVASLQPEPVRKAVLTIILADALFVLAALVLSQLYAAQLSASAQLMIWLVSLSVTCLALLQAYGWATLQAQKHSSFSCEAAIQATLPEVWQALAQIGDIHLWNPGVEHSFVSSELTSGLGAMRQCDLAHGKYLQEEVVEFVPEQAISLRINQSNLPIESAVIRFTLRAEGEFTTVTVSPRYRLKYGALGHVINRLLFARMYKQGMHDLLSGLKHWLESTELT